MILRWYRAMDPDKLTGWDTRLVESTIGVPKQVLWGDRDPFIPSRFAERFGGQVTHTQRGHLLMVEDPDFAAARINSLVAAA